MCHLFIDLEYILLPGRIAGRFFFEFDFHVSTNLYKIYIYIRDRINKNINLKLISI
jgi:hypothetical protein